MFVCGIYAVVALCFLEQFFLIFLEFDPFSGCILVYIAARVATACFTSGKPAVLAAKLSKRASSA